MQAAQADHGMRGAGPIGGAAGQRPRSNTEVLHGEASIYIGDVLFWMLELAVAAAAPAAVPPVANTDNSVPTTTEAAATQTPAVGGAAPPDGGGYDGRGPTAKQADDGTR